MKRLRSGVVWIALLAGVAIATREIAFAQNSATPAPSPKEAILVQHLAGTDNCTVACNRERALFWASGGEKPHIEDAFRKATRLDLPWDASCTVQSVLPTDSGKWWIVVRAKTGTPAESDTLYLVSPDGRTSPRSPGVNGGLSPFMTVDRGIFAPSRSGYIRAWEDVEDPGKPENVTAAEMSAALVSFGDGKHYLAGTHRNGLWLIDRSGSARPKLILPDVFFGWGDLPPDCTWNFCEIDPGRRVVVQSAANELYCIDVDGGTKSAGEPKRTSNFTDRLVASAGDRRHIWFQNEKGQVELWDTVKAEARTAILGPLPPRDHPTAVAWSDNSIKILPIPSTHKAYLWDDQGGIFIYDVDAQKFISATPRLPGIAIAKVQRLSENRFAIIPHAAKGVYIGTDGGQILNENQPALREYEVNAIRSIEEEMVSFENNHPLDKGEYFEVDCGRSDPRSFHLIDTEGREIAHVADIVARFSFSRNSGSPLFWVRTMEEIKAIDSRGGEIAHARYPFGEDLGSMIPDGEGGAAWLIQRQKDKFFHVSIEHGTVHLRDIGEIIGEEFGNNFGGLSPSPTKTPGRAWMRGNRTSYYYLLSLDSKSVDVVLSLGGTVLPAPGVATPKAIRVDRKEGVTVRLISDGWTQAPEADGRWKVSLQPEGSVKPNIVPIESITASAEHLDWPSSWPDSKRATVTLDYHDKFGSRMRFVWPQLAIESVQPEPGFLDTPRGRAIAAWLALTAILCVTQLPALSGTVNRYAPILIGPVLGGFAAFQKNYPDLKVDAVWFGSLVGITLVGLTTWGAFDPRLLRRLAAIAPLDKIVPRMLVLPAFRRRFFGEYVARVQRTLDRARSDAKGEQYTAIPAQVLEPADGGLLPQPDLALLERLCDPAKGCNVLIESPGGRGKSALVRRIVTLMLERFRATGSSPIPILCNGEGHDLAELARAELGRHALSKPVFQQQLESGFFLIVIDGLSDRDVKPATLKNFLASAAAEQTRLLCATRPHAALREAFLSDQSAIVVEPQRLDEKTIDRFEENYLGPARRLSPAARAACRGRDGTYLPVLVRLAIKAGAADLCTIADVYGAAFDALVKSKDQRDAAAKLCIATYWVRGSRTLSAKVPAHEESITQLVAAGILVDTQETRNRANGTAEELKFFHDSMQSFLTAEGLFALKNNTGWARLAEAAGDQRFTTAQSDLVTGGGSELFQMCVQVFRPREEVRQALRSDLHAWGRAHHTALSADLILRGVPEALREKLPTEYTIPQLLEAAVNVCGSDDPAAIDEALANLSRLYTCLAPVVWVRVGGQAGR